MCRRITAQHKHPNIRNDSYGPVRGAAGGWQCPNLVNPFRAQSEHIHANGAWGCATIERVEAHAGDVEETGKLRPETGAANSERSRPAFRDDVAHHSGMMPPGVRPG